MAFPTTAVLDHFIGTDGVLLSAYSANWAGPIADVGSELTIQSDAASSVSGSKSDYWAAKTFGPDSEAFCTLVGAITTLLQVWLRVINPGTATVSGYGIRWSPLAGSVSQIFRIDNNTNTQLGATIAATYADTDQFGADVQSATITLYKNGTAQDTRTDSTYSAAGNIGLQINTGSVDNFGGGTVVVPSVVGTEGQFPVFVGGRGAC